MKTILKKLKDYVNQTTTISSLIIISSLILICIIIDLLLKPTGIMFSAIYYFALLNIYFLITKINDTFFKKEKYNQKSFDATQYLIDLHKYHIELENADRRYFTITERTALLLCKQRQENSKHLKLAIRNAADKIGIALIICIIAIWG
jgi:hypothetical protein